jgi:hypothetical protein
LHDLGDGDAIRGEELHSCLQSVDLWQGVLFSVNPNGNRLLEVLEEHSGLDHIKIELEAVPDQIAFSDSGYLFPDVRVHPEDEVGNRLAVCTLPDLVCVVLIISGTSGRERGSTSSPLTYSQRFMDMR